MKTRAYETLYIVRPDLKSEDLNKIINRFKKVVEDKNGTVSKAELWETRDLAYEIAGLKRGSYVIMIFEAPADVPAELGRLMRISDDVIRYTILNYQEPQAAQA
jgi:small subunit ribosomal protein S6